MSKNNNEENILWLTSEMKSRDDENDEIVTEYNWIYYNGKNDFEYITLSLFQRAVFLLLLE